MREGEQNAKQKDEVYDELKSESNTLRENCVQRERKQFMEPENLERSERLNSEEDGEINSFVIEVPAEKICVDEATTVGAVAVGVDANFRKEDDGEVEVNFVDNVNVLETGSVGTMKHGKQNTRFRRRFNAKTSFYNNGYTTSPLELKSA